MLVVIFLLVIFISQVKTAEHLRLIFGAKTIFDPLDPLYSTPRFACNLCLCLWLLYTEMTVSENFFCYHYAYYMKCPGFHLTTKIYSRCEAPCYLSTTTELPVDNNQKNSSMHKNCFYIQNYFLQVSW